MDVLFLFFPHYLVLSQYVNLKERPPFNLEAALAEHSSRDRKTELERAKKVTLSSRKAEAKLSRSEAGGEKKKQKRCAADCDDDDDDDEDDDYGEDEEAETEMEDAENKKALDRMRDEDSDNFSSEDSNVASSLFQQRSASKRQVKMSAKLEEQNAVVEELEVVEEKEEKEQARAKAEKEKVVKKAVASKSKVPAKKADLKKDKIVGKAEVVKKVAKNVKSVAKNAKSLKGVKNVKSEGQGVKKVVDAEKVAGTGIFQVDLKSLTTRNDKLSIFVVDEYVSLLKRAVNFPPTTRLLSTSNWMIFDRCVDEKDRYEKLMNFVDKAEMDGVERIF